MVDSVPSSIMTLGIPVVGSVQSSIMTFHSVSSICLSVCRSDCLSIERLNLTLGELSMLPRRDGIWSQCCRI